MSDIPTQPPKPQPCDRLAAAPHWHSREVLRHVSGVTMIALVPVMVAGALFFGLLVFLYVGVAIACAVMCEVLTCRLVNRRVQPRTSHTIVLATVLAMAMPPTCGILVVALGSVLMVLAKEIFGGLGHYLWNPVLVARALLCFAFPLLMYPDHWPVLKREHVADVALGEAEPHETNISWLDRAPGSEAGAWSAPRPVQIITQAHQPRPTSTESASQFSLQLLRDRLPPVIDCLLGSTGGGIGETSVIAILLGGIFLVYRGYVHWTLPVGAVLGMVITAGILPIFGGLGGDTPIWFPFRLLSGNPALPVGLMLVGYHLIVGEFMFVVFFVASDMTASPMRARGHFWYGLGIGGLTAALRFAGFSGGAAFWALLIMNTLVPAIDRLTRIRVYGT